MTEEENKAIEKFELWVNGKTYLGIGSKEAETLLNLIEKLQKENERQQDITIEKDRQLHLMHKEIQSVREQAWEITDKSLKDKLMLNTPKIIIESKEDIKGLLDNYIPKDKIREKMQEIMNYTYSTADERHNQDYAYDRLKELLEEE